MQAVRAQSLRVTSGRLAAGATMLLPMLLNRFRPSSSIESILAECFFRKGRMARRYILVAPCMQVQCVRI
jgi:hypothetical protein